MDDGYAVMEQDLQSIEARYQELLRDDESSVAREVGALLTLHSHREESALHPLLRRYVDGGDDLADRAVAEHAAIATMIAELAGSSAPDLDEARTGTLLADLGTAIAAHMEFVQGEVIPEMQSCGVDGAQVGQQLTTD